MSFWWSKVYVIVFPESVLNFDTNNHNGYGYPAMRIHNCIKPIPGEIEFLTDSNSQMSDTAKLYIGVL